MGPYIKNYQGPPPRNRLPRPTAAVPGELEQFARHLEENIRRWTIGTSGGRRGSSTLPEGTRRRSSGNILPTLNTDTLPASSRDPLPYFTESPVDEHSGASPFRYDGDRTPTTASPTKPGVAHSPGARSEDFPSPSEADTPLSAAEAAAAAAAAEPDLPPRPCGCSQSSRNLVVCIDGTSNKFGLKNTNVVELYSLLLKDGSQLTYYDSGIGTYAKPSWKKLSYLRRVLDHKIDLAIAWNFERILLGAYRWLAEHYREGDNIFLFGFSRGAYQVRALSAMIDKVGLIHRGNEAQIPFAFELFASVDDADFSEDTTPDATAEDGSPSESPQSSSNKSDTVQMAEHFKQTFSRVVQVHFVGTWDTVSSVGIVRNKVLPGAASGMQHVCYFRHGLALDERRVKFLPEFANGGSTLKANQGDSGPEKDGESGEPRVKEVWFAGTHSDIGGGNVHNLSMDHSGPPLRWMSYEATKHGLLMHPFRGYWSLDKSMEVHESLKGVWKLFEFLPIKRLSYKDSDSLVWWPHLGRGRRIQPGQSIHSSVFRRGSDAYVSHAVLPYPARNKSEDWKNLQDSLSQGNLQITLEKDLYGTVSYLVEQSKRHLEDAALNKKEILTDLFKTMMSVEGRRALHEVPDAAQHIIPLFWANSGKAPFSESRKAATIFITMDIRLLAAFLYAQTMYANKIYLTADRDAADLSMAVIQLNGEFVKCETSDESVMHVSMESIHNALPRIFSVVQVLRHRRNANARLISYQSKR